MPVVDAVVECPTFDSFRVRQVCGMFDMKPGRKGREAFSVEVPGLEEEWEIGVIVGPSGSGKSTIAKQAFGDSLYCGGEWPAEQAVIDGFGESGIKETTQVLTAVGFSSPPAWVKPYMVLSGGEKFRCDLAKALLGDGDLVAFDEFTSVVDRTVAKTGSVAISKAIRKGVVKKRFVAVTCHYDIVEWLEPDWVVDMATQTLARGRLRRPSINAEVIRCDNKAWQLFARHHYLSGSCRAGMHYMGLVEEQPAVFVAIVPYFGKETYRVTRVVTMPDYQGVGLGGRVLEAAAQDAHEQTGAEIRLSTSHPAMIAALQHSERWHLANYYKHGTASRRHQRSNKSLASLANTVSTGRRLATFRFHPAKTDQVDPEQGTGERDAPSECTTPSAPKYLQSALRARRKRGRKVGSRKARPRPEQHLAGAQND